MVCSCFKTVLPVVHQIYFINKFTMTVSLKSTSVCLHRTSYMPVNTQCFLGLICGLDFQGMTWGYHVPSGHRQLFKKQLRVTFRMTLILIVICKAVPSIAPSCLWQGIE